MPRLHPICRLALLALWLGFAQPQILAEQSALVAGDIVFLQASADAPDTFAFSPLVNLTAGTVIHFTDEGRTNTDPTAFSSWRLSGANGTGSFGEDVYTWVAPTAIAAGTVISLSSTQHNLTIAASGDNLFAFQGTIYRPQFITAVGWDLATPIITSGTATSNDTYLPSSLTLGSTAMARTATGDNIGYTGATTSGAPGVLRSAINNQTNWSFNNTTLITPPGSLTVTDPVAAPVASAVVAGYSFGISTATYTQSPTVEPSHLDLSNVLAVNLSGTLDADGASGFAGGQDLLLTGGWSTAAAPVLASDQAIAFSLTVETGYEFDFTHLSFAAQASDATGPQTVALFMSTDGFATATQVGSNLNLTGTAWGVFDFTDTASTVFTGTIDFRLYAFNAANGGIGMEFDEIWIDGVLAIPEPSVPLSLLAGVSTLLGFRRWKQQA